MAVHAVDSLRVAGGDLTVYIPDIGVSSARLRRGLGGALIAAAAERVRARGLEALVLNVGAEDVGARDFFPKARLWRNGGDPNVRVEGRPKGIIRTDPNPSLKDGSIP